MKYHLAYMKILRKKREMSRGYEVLRNRVEMNVYTR
jgi:hypothetical protein